MEIAVISGKGGTGKSSISAAFATLNGEVVLADCDVDAANLYLLFNPDHQEEQVYVAGYKARVDELLCSKCHLCLDTCRFDAISLQNGQIIINEISCDGCFLCSRICPENAIQMVPNDKSRLYSGSFRNGKMVYGRLAPGEENSGKLVNMVREKAKQISNENNLETIILDGPPGIGCPVISTITGVDKVIIVTEPTISGLHDLERAAEIVLKSNRNPSVIINKWDLNASMTERIGAWCNKKNIPVAGILPFDKKMVESMVQSKTITEFDAENEISLELKKIWNKMIRS
ncbi:MAG: ATP-binding protein [Bacteroidales bacterium]